MIHARYATPDRSVVAVRVGEGDMLGSLVGPVEFTLTLPSPDNAEHDALMKMVDGGRIEIEAFEAPPAPVPESISDRQFAQALAKLGVISREEALQFVKVGAVPDALQAVIDSVEDPDARFDLDMAVSGATKFDRSNPSTIALADALRWSPEQMDDLWRSAAAIP